MKNFIEIVERGPRGATGEPGADGADGEKGDKGDPGDPASNLVISVNTKTGAVVLTQDDIADGSTAKQYTATEKTKLAGVQAGATANSSDAVLEARANHTGTQLAATISDFSAAAKTATVADAINDGTTDVAPSQNAVFDALALKVTANGGITGATKTKITYDAKGLVTSGADATTADIADGTNKRYVTDAEKTAIDALGTISTQAANNVAITGGSITGMSTPTGGSDVATKSYVDAATSGLSQKASCKLATTAALAGVYVNGSSGVGATFTYTATGVDTVDGVALTTGMRILVKNQAAAEQNGIYTVTTAGSVGVAGVLTRAVDYDQAAEIVEGTYTIAEEGTANAGTLWLMTQSAAITVGTTAVNFTELAVGAQSNTYTGDVTGSGSSSIALTIAANAVTNAKAAQMTTLTVKANTTGGTANASDVAITTTFKTALALVSSDVGLGSVTNDAQLKAADKDTDVALAANSDTKIASQKAVKAYVDTKRKTYVAVTGTYAVLTTDEVVEATSGTFTATLPTAVSVAGKLYIIKNSGTGVLTVATTSAQTIDGATTKLLGQYQSISVISNGANWIIV